MQQAKVFNLALESLPTAGAFNSKSALHSYMEPRIINKHYRG